MARALRGVPAVVVAAVLAAGCTAGDGAGEPTIQSGGDYLVSHWPLRGSLADDPGTREEVTALVRDWRTPDGVATHPEATAILWLGEVDGAALGIVDFRPADSPNQTWLLEVTGEVGSLAVTAARRYWDGPVLNDDVLAVWSPGVGPRYLVSARLGTLTGPGGDLPLREDGLTERVDAPPCRAVGLTVRVGGAERRLVHLGWDIPAPFYPLLPDDHGGDGPAAPVLAGIDTCAAMAPDGWLHAVGSAHDQPAIMVNGFPVLRRLGALAVDRPGRVDSGGLPGTLATLRAEYASVDGGVRYADWLLWTYPAGGAGAVTGVRVPPEAEPLASTPGLLVTPVPERPLEIGYTRDGVDHLATVRAP